MIRQNEKVFCKRFVLFDSKKYHLPAGRQAKTIPIKTFSACPERVKRVEGLSSAPRPYGGNNTQVPIKLKEKTECLLGF